MTKRLICLMLAMLMALCVFTSCSDDGDAIDDTVNQASRFTSAINLWVITESELVEQASALLTAGYDPDDYATEEKLAKRTEEEKATVNALSEDVKAAWEQLDDIGEAINKITKKQFKTQVNVRYVTEEGYYTAVEKAFVEHEAAIAEAKKNGTSLTPDVTQEETVLNEYGIPELKYPTAYDFQVDVLFIGSAQKYREYAAKEWITTVDDLVEDSAVQLTYFVSSVLLNATYFDGASYAIPNNNVIGEYTYLAVNEELTNYYLTTPEKLENSLFSNESKKFLDYVYHNTEGEKVYPIYSETGKVDMEMLHYWTYAVEGNEYIQDPATFSLFGGFYYKDSVQGSSIRSFNLLTDQLYTNNIQTKLYYETTPGYITTDPNATAAVRIVKGGYEKRAELEQMGYKVLTVEAPRATDEDVFGSMFAVGSHTRDEGRAMEIITYINTNAELRNLLQYGLENVNYTLKSVTDEEGVSRVYAEMTPTNKYVMDLAKTGNMFVAYPNSKETVRAWEYGKLQNLDAVEYPTVGVYFNLEDYKVDAKGMCVLNAVSAKFKTNVLDQLTVPGQIKEIYDRASILSTDHTKMAELLLELIGEEVTYTAPGAETATTVTVEELANALRIMNTALDEENNKTEQSFHALYQDWVKNSGVNEQ
ncbi:MAG: hypothetical protein E7624_07120 [Ruminococcaceae bacterium]|nr:hypothetical protein [Oscillospiraceae bacterium]